MKSREYREIEKHIVEIRGRLSKMKSATRRRLRKNIESLDKTNCWFAMFWAKELILKNLDDITKEAKKRRVINTKQQ